MTALLRVRMSNAWFFYVQQTECSFPCVCCWQVTKKLNEYNWKRSYRVTRFMSTPVRSQRGPAIHTYIHTCSTGHAAPHIQKNKIPLCFQFSRYIPRGTFTKESIFLNILLTKATGPTGNHHTCTTDSMRCLKTATYMLFSTLCLPYWECP
jgi:hypothetical protein